MNIEAIIFDLDGTLLDTLEDIADSANRVLTRHGFPTHKKDDFRFFVGDGVNMLLKRLLPNKGDDAELFEKCVREFREEYSRNWDSKTRPYKGVNETLRELTTRKTKMAILSNKPDDFTKMCVDGFLSGWRFEMVLGHNEGIPHKPDPTGALQIAETMEVAPENILYVGDTATDMKTALSAGMFPAGALWGFRSFEELKESGAKVLLNRPQEILDLIQFYE